MIAYLLNYDLPDIVIFTVSCLMALQIFYFIKYKYGRCKLPGPLPWLFFGNVFQVGRKPHLTFMKWKKYYGDVFQVKLGSRMFVVLNSKELMLEALGGNKRSMSGRPFSPTTELMNEGKNFALSKVSAETHKIYKKMATEMLKKVVFSKHTTTDKLGAIDSKKQKSFIEKGISIHTKCFVERLVEVSKQINESVDRKKRHYVGGRYAPLLAEVNIEICKQLYFIVYGERNPSEDEIEKFVNLNEQFAKMMSLSNIYDSFPVAKLIFPRYLNGFVELLKNLDRIFDGQFKKKNCNLVQQEQDVDSVKNVLDEVLKEYEHNKKSNYNQTMTMSIPYTFLLAGFDTTPKVVEWLICYAAAFPDAQEKASQEISTFFHKHNRMPIYAERYDVPYLWSFLIEVIRHSSFVPIPPPHEVIEHGVQLRDFNIPKGRSVLLNFYSANHDQEIWKTPEHFRPERFMKPDGTLDMKLEQEIVLFGFGRRKCPGKLVAEIYVFHYFSALMFHSEISFRSGTKGGIPEKDYGLTMVPLNTDLTIAKRNF